MESIAELRRICARENDGDNRRTMLVASRVSIYFSRAFIAAGFSANQVTAVFMALGLAGAACFFGPGLSWACAGYLLHRLHVICDVSDGEVARYRKTSSAAGAYLDFLTHYFVYSLLLFGVSFRFFLDTRETWSIVAGFALVIASVMNRASCDCWFRANFGAPSREAIEEGRIGQPRSGRPAWQKTAVLAAAHATSVQTFLNVYLLALTFERFAGIEARRYCLPAYAAILLAFSVGRIAATIARGRVPRRATYY